MSSNLTGCIQIFVVVVVIVVIVVVCVMVFWFWALSIVILTVRKRKKNGGGGCSNCKFGRVVKALALGASLERGMGSNPIACILFLAIKMSKDYQVLPGLEPGLQGSKPWVLTNYTIEPDMNESRGPNWNVKKEQKD